MLDECECLGVSCRSTPVRCPLTLLCGASFWTTPFASTRRCRPHRRAAAVWTPGTEVHVPVKFTAVDDWIAMDCRRPVSTWQFSGTGNVIASGPQLSCMCPPSLINPGQPRMLMCASPIFIPATRSFPIRPSKLKSTSYCTRKLGDPHRNDRRNEASPQGLGRYVRPENDLDNPHLDIARARIRTRLWTFDAVDPPRLSDRSD